MEKPRQGLGGLMNISFGFFGIQIGFALQNANMSRVFQTLGASMDDLPALWVAAPLTGLLVQPVIGFMSDRTWSRLGRRRPYFMTGAVLAALALFLMPLAPAMGPALMIAATLLWLLDASLNVSMEPFRAFVGDMLRTDQHSAGYAVQTAFIGAGAVIGSIFPWLLEHAGVANIAAAGELPDTVKWSFWVGALAILGAVSWTVVSTREYSPDEQAQFGENEAQPASPSALLAHKAYTSSGLWALAGLAVIALVEEFAFEKEVLLLGALLIGYGVLSALAIGLAREGRGTGMLASIVGDFAGMPQIMKQLSLVQFFSWSALFIMWINTTPVVAQEFFHTTDPASAAFQEAGNWVGVLFSVYNGVAAVAALAILPPLAARIGKARTHGLCLLAGAAGFAGFLLLDDPQQLIWCEVGIGVAWASILAMPFAILASSLPQAKLGTYMGLFNIFIVLPQLLVATVMGSIMHAWFPDRPLWTLAFAAATIVAAAAATLLLDRDA